MNNLLCSGPEPDLTELDVIGKTTRLKKPIGDTVCVLRADCTIISNAKLLLERAQLR